MSFYASLDRFQKMKRQRVAYMLDELLERGGEADLNEFIGSIAMNFGIRRKTQEEYLQDLKYAGAIDVRNDKVLLLWSKEDARKWLEKQGVRKRSSR